MRTFFILMTVFFAGLGVFLASLTPELIDRAREREANKAAALTAGPPAALPIESIDLGPTPAPAEEGTIIAQIPPPGVLAEPSAGARWIAPLLATTETDPNAPPIAWAAHPRLTWSVATDAAIVRGDGPAGGVLVELNGFWVDAKAHRSAIEAASPGALGDMVIEPFLGGRAAALAPDDDAVFDAYLGYVAPVLAFLFAGFCWLGARSAKIRAALLHHRDNRRTLWRRR